MRSNLGPYILALVLVLSTSPAFGAQAGQAELTGEVRDPSGAVIEKATVRAVDVDTNQTFEATTEPKPGGGFTREPGFGSITSAGDPRVIQFGLKLHF